LDGHLATGCGSGAGPLVCGSRMAPHCGPLVRVVEAIQIGTLNHEFVERVTDELRIPPASNTQPFLQGNIKGLS